MFSLHTRTPVFLLAAFIHPAGMQARLAAALAAGGDELKNELTAAVGFRLQQPAVR